MATTNNPNRVSGQIGKLFLPIDTAVNSGAINPGDLCYWTTNSPAGLASYGASLTMTSTLVGLLSQRVGVSADLNPLSGGIANALENFEVDTFGLFKFKGTSGDTYSNFDEVTIGADAQTVVKTSTLVQAAPTLAHSGTDGTWTAAAHTVQTVIVTILGRSKPSAAASVTTLSTEHITVTPAAALPSWALYFEIYVDGVLAGTQSSNAATSYLGPLTSGVVPVKSITRDALAIGRVELPAATRSAVTSIAYSATPVTLGIAGSQIPVRLYPYTNGVSGLF